MYYLQYIIHDSDHIGNYWIQVTNGNFNKFRMMDYDDFSRLCEAGISNTIPTSTTSLLKLYSALDNFKRSIKNDHTLFLVFNYQAMWDYCNHSTISTACTQDVKYMFGEYYSPLTTDIIELFRGNKKYMYSVFVKFFVTNQGNKIVCERQIG